MRPHPVAEVALVVKEEGDKLAGVLGEGHPGGHLLQGAVQAALLPGGDAGQAGVAPDGLRVPALDRLKYLCCPLKSTLVRLTLNLVPDRLSVCGMMQHIPRKVRPERF